MNNISEFGPLVSVEWLNHHLNDKDLLIFDASMNKVTTVENDIEKLQIPNAQFFDIKYIFSNTNAPFPNTIPLENQFSTEAQNLGVDSNSKIVVYDDKGIYSSARVWYLFKAFGFDNIAVLDGGLPEWKLANYPLELKTTEIITNGNFIASYHSERFKFFEDIQNSTNNKGHLIIDARSNGRFNSISPEPRKGLRSGSIPNSINLPFQDVLDNGKYC